MSTLTNWNQLKKIWFTKKKLILEKVEIIVLNVLDAVLVLTAAKVVITAAAHSVALNDHREKAHTLLTPWSPLPPCLSRRDWHCLDPSFQTEINTWMNPPPSPHLPHVCYNKRSSRPRLKSHLTGRAPATQSDDGGPSSPVRWGA